MRTTALASDGGNKSGDYKTTRPGISSGCSRATVENFLPPAAPVLATSNFVASNRLLNLELAALARSRAREGVAPWGEI